MSSHIIASFQPAKKRLVSLLKEVNQLEIKSPEPSMTIEEKEDFYVIRKRVLEDKLRRIQLCVTTLESINDKWFTYTQQIVTMKRREEEEEKYKTEGDQGIFQLLHERKEAVITITMHKDEVDQNLKQLSKELTNKTSKRRGKALQAISGYDIAPENYEVIRKLLNEKYGDHSIVTTLLYNELQSIKRNEREWIGTIENIERVLRQLEALGESLDHSNIEILIESKLPLWILNKIYKHKKKDMSWSILKLRNFLTSLVNVNEQIRNCQHSLTQLNMKSTTTKPEQKQRYNPGGTSALSTIKDNRNTSKTTTTKRRPCVFCNQDHWDCDCVICSTESSQGIKEMYYLS
uniref:Gag protein, putative n=1 Tax=Brugia malayi TaxID=6279 RepID=A8PPL1_BRUMA